ncbi:MULTISPECIES: hypothetical protein [Cetobacterium]|jgi:hypothetical protein|uniref:Uncharacterized protein n=1 Tax=Candidatus Cetobacterium colombiensis TaxID=3073100 RepID=A0ABU4WBL0_9FUSO|nr:hypothetical protein [Candidatus Cetobacterium colombiensis]MDX8336927.1 hypothetical protein [Candidatus Cetobacterium colombiensis]
MKKLLFVGILVLGTVTFSANGTGKLAGNSQPNGTTKMEANNGICTVTGTTQRANKGEFVGPGREQSQGRGKMRGNGQGRMINKEVNATANTTNSKN